MHRAVLVEEALRSDPFGRVENLLDSHQKEPTEAPYMPDFLALAGQLTYLGRRALDLRLNT
jgi:hypothetical protein